MQLFCYVLCLLKCFSPHHSAGSLIKVLIEHSAMSLPKFQFVSIRTASCLKRRPSWKHTIHRHLSIRQALLKTKTEIKIACELKTHHEDIRPQKS
jgi:hypothetical protein